MSEPADLFSRFTTRAPLSTKYCFFHSITVILYWFIYNNLQKYKSFKEHGILFPNTGKKIWPKKERLQKFFCV